MGDGAEDQACGEYRWIRLNKQLNQRDLLKHQRQHVRGAKQIPSDERRGDEKIVNLGSPNRLETFGQHGDVIRLIPNRVTSAAMAARISRQLLLLAHSIS